MFVWPERCQACEQNASAAYFDSDHVITRLLWVEFPKAFPFRIPARDFNCIQDKNKCQLEEIPLIEGEESEKDKKRESQEKYI